MLGKAQSWDFWLARTLLLLALALYLLHFRHLTADFPHDSPWDDWAQYTDEGWYGDGAIRHYVWGHWYLRGDFNPAVAMPVWPLLEAGWFRFTGVSLGAARALAVLCFGFTLLALHAVLRRHLQQTKARWPALAPALAVFLAAASPFLFVFDRMAILEPPLVALALGTLWAAGCLAPSHSPHSRNRFSSRWAPAALAGVLLAGVLLAATLLTKPTAAALAPGILVYLWRQEKGSGRARWFAFGTPLAVAVTVWVLYFFGLVRPHYLEDYRYLFEANAYTGFQLEPLSTVIVHTIADSAYMGPLLWWSFVVTLGGLTWWRPQFFRNALVPALLLWVAGSLLLTGYHNNLQPRYYLPTAVPVTALMALALQEVLGGGLALQPRALKAIAAVAVAACTLAIAVPGIAQEWQYLREPSTSFYDAGQQIARLVRANPGHSPLLLSVSGSDLTLMTGIPSIDDDFGTLDLDQRLRLYRPGWFVAWNEVDDDKMDALRTLYRPVRVASFPATDDPDRNLLVLYRLDPAQAPGPRHRRPPKPVPPALRTRFGQQPTGTQLRH